MKKFVADWINVIFGVRKLIIMLALFMVGVIFRLKGLLSGSELVDLLKSTSISFFAANGTEHLMNTVKAYIQTKGPVPAATIPNGDNLVDDSEIDDTPEAPKAGAK